VTLEHDPSFTPQRRRAALRPSGFRPLLNGEAARDRTLVSTCLDLWEKEGFTQVSPIQVDAADTLLADKSDQLRQRTFRFMDPASGDMLALLPDVTLGIARLAKGELAAAPRPLRLSYEGQAIRVSGSTTRPIRQFGQVGLEVIGADKDTPGQLTALALQSLIELGLDDLHLCLTAPPFAQSLISELGLSPDLAQALDRRDEGKVRALAGDSAPRLLAILAGDLDQEPELQPLKSLASQLSKTFPQVQVRCEPFEQRGFAFQSSPSFAIYSPLYRGELARGGAYALKGDPCFGFTFYRDALLGALAS